MKTIDARTQHNPDPGYIAELIARAVAKVQSRNKLAPMMGISRRKLNYLEAGQRALPNGTVVPVVASFAEQFILERIAGS